MTFGLIATNRDCLQRLSKAEGKPSPSPTGTAVAEAFWGRLCLLPLSSYIRLLVCAGFANNFFFAAIVLLFRRDLWRVESNFKEAEPVMKAALEKNGEACELLNAAPPSPPVVKDPTILPSPPALPPSPAAVGQTKVNDDLPVVDPKLSQTTKPKPKPGPSKEGDSAAQGSENGPTVSPQDSSGAPESGQNLAAGSGQSGGSESDSGSPSGLPLVTASNPSSATDPNPPSGSGQGASLSSPGDGSNSTIVDGSPSGTASEASADGPAASPNPPAVEAAPPPAPPAAEVKPPEGAADIAEAVPPPPPAVEGKPPQPEVVVDILGGGLPGELPKAEVKPPEVVVDIPGAVPPPPALPKAEVKPPEVVVDVLEVVPPVAAAPPPREAPAEIAASPQPEPAHNPPVIISDLDAFKNACKAVGIAERYGEDVIHEYKINGRKDYTTPAEAIMAIIEDTYKTFRFHEFVCASNFEDLNEKLRFSWSIYASYAIAGDVTTGKWGDFTKLLDAYAEKAGVEYKFEKDAISEAIVTIKGITNLDPGTGDYLGKRSLDAAAASVSSLGRAIGALSSGNALFSNFDLPTFVQYQACVLKEDWEYYGFAENGVTDFSELVCSSIKSDNANGNNGKYYLKDLIHAVTTYGSGERGVTIAEGKEDTIIEAEVAEEFLKQVNDFRAEHAKAIATAAIEYEGKPTTVFALYDKLYKAEATEAKLQAAVAAADLAFEEAKAKFVDAA